VTSVVGLDDLIRRALDEDLGTAGDITTQACIPVDARSAGVIVARAAGTIAGLEAAARVFTLLDGGVEVVPETEDGAAVGAGTVLARVAGPSRPLLSGERVALNLLGRLSGIATATSDLVRRVDGTGARITDTRKTTPGLRALEKYAVRMGGGVNHRFGLHDAVMIKDNHIVAAGGIRRAVDAVRTRIGHTVKIEVEADDLEQVALVLEAAADIVLLDNMAPADLRRAVAMVDGRMIVEASGGITPETVRQVAESGVDVISVGYLTHSAPSLDVALDLLAG
jgi:nicotinate-nucleotide pyrophosphorylase (carboxylating)